MSGKSFDRYLRRDANFGFTNFNPVKAGLPADFVLSRGNSYYLVRTEFPPEPLGKCFVKDSTPQFAAWKRFKRDRYSEFDADLFNFGGDIMKGWWFDKELPPVWVD